MYSHLLIRVRIQNKLLENRKNDMELEQKRMPRIHHRISVCEISNHQTLQIHLTIDQLLEM